MARRYTKDDIEIGDYIQLHGEEIGEWFKITYKHEHACDGFDCECDFGTPHNQIPYAHIADLKLESEMDYAF